MFRCVFVVGAVCLVAGAVLAGQAKTVPRPPAQAPGQAPAGESAAPDGYQPLPAVARTDARAGAGEDRGVHGQTFAEGLNGAAFRFLPDGRILLGERNGRIRIIGKDGKAVEPLAGMPANMFMTGAGAGAVQRAAGPELRDQPHDLLHLCGAARRRRRREAALARARPRRERAISADEKSLEDVKDLLDAEGTGGRLSRPTTARCS